jgi:hypothetical protein
VARSGGPKARVTELFMLPSDENAVVEAIRGKVPGAALVNDMPWENPNVPPVCEQIPPSSRTIGIWNQVARPRLVGRSRSNGRIELPDSDYVVIWRRSLERTPGVLSHGHWATSLTVVDAQEMSDFVAAIWKILFAMTTNRMRRSSAPDPNTPERRFRVGETAFREADEGRLRLMADSLQLAPEAGYVWSAR